jgi:hypothetical protein
VARTKRTARRRTRGLEASWKPRPTAFDLPRPAECRRKPDSIDRDPRTTHTRPSPRGPDKEEVPGSSPGSPTGKHPQIGHFLGVAPRERRLSPIVTCDQFDAAEAEFGLCGEHQREPPRNWDQAGAVVSSAQTGVAVPGASMRVLCRKQVSRLPIAQRAARSCSILRVRRARSVLFSVSVSASRYAWSASAWRRRRLSRSPRIA